MGDLGDAVRKKKAAVAEQPPKRRTLEDALNELTWRHRGCHHEEEIADDVIGEVKTVLKEFRLLDVIPSEDQDARGSICRFCSSRETKLVHRSYCVEAP